MNVGSQPRTVGSEENIPFYSVHGKAKSKLIDYSCVEFSCDDVALNGTVKAHEFTLLLWVKNVLRYYCKMYNYQSLLLADQMHLIVQNLEVKFYVV